MSIFSSDDSKLSGLVDTLNEYYNKTRAGKSTGIDYQQATNALRDAYDKSHIDQEMKTDIAKKLKYYAQNAGRSLSNDAPAVINKIKEGGGFVQKLGQSGFAKVLPLLGMGAAAAGVAAIANKAKEGKYGEALGDAADMATDYIPGIGLAKSLLAPSTVADEGSAASFADENNPEFKRRAEAIMKLRQQQGIK